MKKMNMLKEMGKEIDIFKVKGDETFEKLKEILEDYDFEDNINIIIMLIEGIVKGEVKQFSYTTYKTKNSKCSFAIDFEVIKGSEIDELLDISN